jgi:thiamine-monophosphate kinase
LSSSRPSEDELISRFFAPIAGPGGLGLLDDAASMRPPPGQDLVVTADALVAGVHFFADDPAGSIARKCLAVNLSDLAAKGATPISFVLTLALPSRWTAEWLGDFAAGLGQEAARYGCPLLGGDTVRTPGPLTVSITALGSVAAGRMVPRTGVRPGDRLYVSGTIGDAALGLQLRLDVGRAGGFASLGALDATSRNDLLDRYLHPQPRLALRNALLTHASGGMDVSDGLVGDLRKMMRASGCSAEVDLARVPVSEAARQALVLAPDLFDLAVTGGDDYEILASVPPGQAAAFERDAHAAGVPVAAIGTAVPEAAPPRFLGPDGHDKSFVRGSFSHF